MGPLGGDAIEAPEKDSTDDETCGGGSATRNAHAILPFQSVFIAILVFGDRLRAGCIFHSRRPLATLNR